MGQRIAGWIAASIAACTVMVEFGVSRIVDQFTEGGSLVGWLPQLDTVGQTVVAYTYLSRVTSFVLTFVIVAALGYWTGTRLDVNSEYRSVFGSFAIGGGVGYLIGLLVFAFLINGWSTPQDAVLGFGILIGMAVANGIQFALVGLAGAALAEFESTPGSPLNENLTSETSPSSETN